MHRICRIPLCVHGTWVIDGFSLSLPISFHFSCRTWSTFFAFKHFYSRKWEPQRLEWVHMYLILYIGKWMQIRQVCTPQPNTRASGDPWILRAYQRPGRNYSTSGGGRKEGGGGKEANGGSAAAVIGSAGPGPRLKDERKTNRKYCSNSVTLSETESRGGGRKAGVRSREFALSLSLIGTRERERALREME